MLQIFSPYEKYAKYLKWLALVLLSYVFSALSVNLNWGELLKSTLIPSMDFTKETNIPCMWNFGNNNFPYLFFWQTSQEVEEEILGGQTTVKLRKNNCNEAQISEMRIDVWSGMLLSNVVMFFIIAANGAALHANGITNINSAAEAALALKPIAGDQAYLLFALGIIGTGLLFSTDSCRLSFIRNFGKFRLKSGLYRKLKDAHSIYGVIIINDNRISHKFYWLRPNYCSNLPELKRTNRSNNSCYDCTYKQQ